MFVRDLMTINPNTVHPDMPLSQALDLMNDVTCRHLPVLENGMLIGMISDRDLRLAANMPMLDPTNMSRLKIQTMDVGEFMTPDPITITSTATVQEAASTLNQFTISALPVLDDGLLVGIITVYDILDYVAHLPDTVAVSGAP
jgi:acetoin utilization protein AcuB